ncbi:MULTISPECIES: hypothetical protein [unclassified Streptomyces]|uniref:hypothetical protein n=1 Tax=unclassified Streptomyces TaxID=2593676 RepID=UPI00117E373A|nr:MULTISPECIES: hypothetical protein [unclassified Streptomyces]TRO60499.1 hypothetical protein E4K73_29830 [Streptomyces sp. IB201691-2A2]
MRALVSRGLLLPPLVCAALVCGPVATATAASDVSTGSAGGPVAVAPLSVDAADVTLERIHLLEAADHGNVLTPLLDALTPLADRGHGPLDAAEAAEHNKAVTEATASVEERLESMDRPADRVAADPVSDAVAGLQESLGGLLSALTSLDVGGVVAEVPKVLTNVIGVVTGLLGGGLPALPSVPAPTE